MNRKTSFFASIAFACSAFFAHGIIGIILAEHWLADDEPTRLFDFALTNAAVYLLIVQFTRATITRALQGGSQVYNECIPQHLRGDTADLLVRTCATFLWIPVTVYLCAITFMEDSMTTIQLRRSPTYAVCMVVTVLDPIQELSAATDKMVVLHHVLMVSFTLLMSEWDRTLEPGWVLMGLQYALDRVIWVLIFVSRMTYFKQRCAAALEDESKKKDIAIDIDACGDDPKAAPSPTDIDSILPQSTEVLRPWYSVTLVYYLMVRVVVFTLVGVYMSRYWTDIKVYWRVLLIIACIAYFLIDGHFYVLMYQRSSFGPSSSRTAKGTAPHPHEPIHVAIEVTSDGEPQIAAP